MLDNDSLLLVALGAFLRRESLAAFLVAGTASLAGIDVGHGDDVSTLLHLENARMTISALEAFIGMHLAVEHHLACAFAVELYGLASRNCEAETERTNVTITRTAITRSFFIVVSPPFDMRLYTS